MKNILNVILVLLFIFKGNFVFSQWQSANSGTSNNIVDICFPTDSIGYAITQNGDLLKSLDQGTNWNILVTLNGTFTSICALGSDTIFVGGNHIYRSDNAGSSWVNLITFPYTIPDLQFFTSKEGIYIKPYSWTCTSSAGSITKYEYQVFHTADFGSTWQYKFGLLDPSSRFQLINDSIAYITGVYHPAGIHCSGPPNSFGMKTTDRGNSWNTAPAPGAYYSSFYFINDTIGYFFGGFTSSGELWKMTGSNIDLVRQNISSYNFVFVNEIDGALISSAKDIYKTRSGGYIWELDFTSLDTLNKLLNCHNKQMFAIGKNGTILKKPIVESLYPDSIYDMYAYQSQLVFDTVLVGGMKIKQVVIHNDGSVPLSIHVSSSDTFQVSTSNGNFSSTINFTLAAQKDSTLNIRFSPGDTLFYKDTLVISANNVSSIYIPLEGFGSKNLIGSLSDSMLICSDTIDVVGDFTIENDGKLIICPGTVLNFKDNYSFKVYGTLVADGLQNDSIVFRPENELVGWNGLSFYSTTSLDTSVLRFCSLRNVNDYAINSNMRFNLIIDNCSIFNSKGGVDSRYGSIIISNNRIFNNISNVPGGGVKLFYDSSIVINNEIFNNTATSGAGIYMINHPPGSSKVIQNLIFNNTGGACGGIYISYGASLLINNTICNNKVSNYPSNVGGVYLHTVDSNTLLLNNIIFNNSEKQLSAYQPNNVVVRFCNVQGGYSNGFGIINQDPGFIDPTDSIGVMATIGNYNWLINQNSPCIDMGDPVFNPWIPLLDFSGNLRIDQNRIDIGAYEYQHIASLNEIDNNLSVSLFPNPFNEYIKVSVDSNLEEFEFILYDSSLRILFHKEISKLIFLYTGYLESGLYLYEIRTKEGLFNTGKVIKN